ncbi:MULTISPECIES: hypothetical protein [Lysinibacillus]|jgi:hypothetical protein|uniref:hypothetical protein n=1 Tax=Lysinibacillus TaxID=400634 RepID=UPI0004DB0DB5|nr:MULTISPECIES: hypothetical protein [Lysinibacillus]AJK88668.1 hypothetical protein HR49_16790 [Lysinibacillus fusiformis]KGA83133.1 hypothetical protein KQ41_11595 [Lysinibacillus fusiformis]KHK55216.1 hypothetical protein PI85_03285 [Lysinibacillus sp. A1]MCE4043336.1 hypothetical protein [Lysinibacillus fusiformis]
MNIVKNDRTIALKVDSYAMALGYQEMGELNLLISTEMDHLEWEAHIIIEGLLKRVNEYI